MERRPCMIWSQVCWSPSIFSNRRNRTMKHFVKCFFCSIDDLIYRTVESFTFFCYIMIVFTKSKFAEVTNENRSDSGELAGGKK